MIPTKLLPTQNYLSECFEYNVMLGWLTWRVRPRNHFKTTQGWQSFNRLNANKRCGSLTKKGYLTIRINKKRYLVHRIVWKLMTGADPKEQIDHKNRIKHDNGFINLREATNAQNQQNRPFTWRPNRHGYPGVWYLKHDKKFAAALKVNGRVMWLGQYNTAFEAHCAYLVGIHTHHGEFAAQQIPVQKAT